MLQNAIDERELRGGNRELKLEENVLFENVTKITWIGFKDRFQTVYNCFHRRMLLRPLSRNQLSCPVTLFHKIRRMQKEQSMYK